MDITLENIGRRFNRDWIFKGIDYTFEAGNTYAILGPNGSGKSTLLQVLNGNLSPSAGTISYSNEGSPVEIEEIYRHISLAAPYLELIEEFTLSEVLDFHFKFKQYKQGIDKTELLDILALQNNKNKLLKYFSSGMKQRVKLALAFCSDTPMLMLDEPAANLDTQGTDWYLNLIKRFSSNRLTIICSNQEFEHSFCDHRLNINDYKTSFSQA